MDASEIDRARLTGPVAGRGLNAADRATFRILAGAVPIGTVLGGHSRSDWMNKRQTADWPEQKTLPTEDRFEVGSASRETTYVSAEPTNQHADQHRPNHKTTRSLF